MIAMNLTGDLGPAVAAFSAQIPGAIKALTDAGQADEAQALQAAHADLVEIAAAGSALVAQIDGALTRQQAAFFAALDARLNGLTITNQLLFPPRK